jgi:hypothetical protein
VEVDGNSSVVDSDGSIEDPGESEVDWLGDNNEGGTMPLLFGTPVVGVVGLELDNKSWLADLRDRW